MEDLPTTAGDTLPQHAEICGVRAKNLMSKGETLIVPKQLLFGDEKHVGIMAEFTVESVGNTHMLMKMTKVVLQ
jgi:hypothetical protein